MKRQKDRELEEAILGYTMSTWLKKNGGGYRDNLWGRRICKDHNGRFCLLYYLQHIGEHADL